MTTDLRTLSAFPNDVTTFRNWGGGISAQLAAIGLVKASDTGQIDWATIGYPGLNAFGGYEIWRFNDSLQATKPVFIKFEYGLGFAAGRMTLQFRVSTATNGAGTLTGQVSAQRSIQPNPKSAGATLPSYCSGSSSRLNLCTNFDSSAINFAMMVLIERTKDAAGNDTVDGIIFYSARGADCQYQFIPFTGSIPANLFSSPALDLSAGGQMVVGSDIALTPMVAFYGRMLYASWCFYRYADITALATIPLTHLGAAHTYMPLGFGASSVHVATGLDNFALAMLWE